MRGEQPAPEGTGMPDAAAADSAVGETNQAAGEVTQVKNVNP